MFQFSKVQNTLGTVSLVALMAALGTLATAPLAFAAAAATAIATDNAASAASTSAPAREEREVDQVIVIGVLNKATAVAPVRASLTSTEPQAIITRRFIEESAPRVGDFSTIVGLAPSMVVTPSSNGPGLSDGGKVQLRGFADGQYNITYDGIAWGDTNGPSHHGTAFFPSSTIGGVIIDRGPGGATDLGQANFGGSINLISLPYDDKFGWSTVLTIGSWNTRQAVATVQSGAIAGLKGAHFLANFQTYDSEGYLSNNFSHGNTQMVKGTIPLGDKFSLTGLFTQTYNFYNKSDVGDASVVQQEVNGPRFSLGSDPNLQNFFRYNQAKKKTDFEYLRLVGDLGSGFALENTVYSYGYVNDTLSGANNLATTAANKVILTPAATYPTPGNGYALPLQTAGIPGYKKANVYRVIGNVFKLNKTFENGTLTAGFLYEEADTRRYIFNIDLVTGRPDFRLKSARTAGPSGTYVQVPLNISYDEFSGWKQYQPFAQFEWRPTEKLTITPGIKYLNFDLFIDAPVEVISGSSQPLNVRKVYTRTLKFLTANYKVSNNIATYAQYAEGFLVPRINNLYVGNIGLTNIQPQISTNYQIGVVANLGNFSIDGDLYYIDFKNKIQAFTDAVTGQSFNTNSGGATYKGIEVQGTYVVGGGFSVFANGSYAKAEGKSDRSNPLYNGEQLTGVPKWTGALGLRYAREHLFTTDDSLVVSTNVKFVGEQFLINAKCSSAPNGICAANAVLTPITGRLAASTYADLSATYRIGNYSLQAQVLNLFNIDDITSVKGSALLAGTRDFATTSAQGGALNSFARFPERSYQLTVKAKF